LDKSIYSAKVPSIIEYCYITNKKHVNFVNVVNITVIDRLSYT